MKKGTEDKKGGIVIVSIYKRNPLIYGVLTLVVISLGLLSRKYSYYLPWWVQRYVGDTLWAVMVFLIIAAIFSKMSVTKIVTISLIFSYLIELSQLYQSYQLNKIRGSVLGALVLGRGFLVSDLVCYTLGIVAAGAAEYFIIIKLRKDDYYE